MEGLTRLRVTKNLTVGLAGPPTPVQSTSHHPHANPTVYTKPPMESGFSGHINKNPPKYQNTLNVDTSPAQLLDSADSSKIVRSSSKIMNSPRPFMSMDEDFNLSESLGDVTLEFTEVHNKKMSELSSARFFWKIEGVDPYLGGLLKWDTPYKIKHFSTGKYLRVVNFGNVIYIC